MKKKERERERERKKKKRLEAGLVFWMKKKTDRGRRESGRWNKQDKKGERERERYEKRAGERKRVERGGGYVKM